MEHRSRTKTKPYLKLGKYLQLCRAKLYRSGLELYRSRKLSFSYSKYSDFERGQALPTFGQIEELAKALNTNERELVFLWIQVQAKSKELKQFFASSVEVDGELEAQVDQDKDYKIESVSIPKEGHKQTWVFGSKEKMLLLKNPWLMDLFIYLTIHYPHFVPAADLGFKTKAKFSVFKKKFLKEFLKNGDIVESDSGIALSLPYIHLPKTSGWDVIRRDILKRAMGALIPELSASNIKNKVSHRTTINKTMSVTEYQYWKRKLEELEYQFANSNFSQKTEKKRPYTLITICAKRNFQVESESSRRKRRS